MKRESLVFIICIIFVCFFHLYMGGYINNRTIKTQTTDNSAEYGIEIICDTIKPAKNMHNILTTRTGETYILKEWGECYYGITINGDTFYMIEEER